MALASKLKAIHSEEQYEEYLREIDRLLDAQDEASQDRLEVISILVEAYEKERHPIPAADPVDVLELFMEDRGLTRKDMEAYLGSRQRVSEVLGRKRTLTLTMIRKLRDGLGIPADLLIG